MAPKRKRAAPATPAKKRRTTGGYRSLFAGPDDWDKLVADSSLSTSSVSIRRPRPNGLQSLTRCSQLAASRHFKQLWEDGNGGGEMWKADWAWLDDRLKDGIRENVYRAWGGFLTPEILKSTFLHPPHLYLPGDLLPAVSETSGLKPFRPSDDSLALFTRLTIKHAPKASDVAIAGLIHFLPNLEEVNLKGCTLAGAKTVETIVKQLPKLRRINLKGTNVGEREAKMLLDTFSKQLEVFKVDNVEFEDVGAVLASQPFPKMTHLCLPGDMSMRGAAWSRKRAVSDPPRLDDSSQESRLADWRAFYWDMLFGIFPAVTHLSLPGWIPDGEEDRSYFGLTPSSRLVKFSVAPGAEVEYSINELVWEHRATLEALHMGRLRPQDDGLGHFHEVTCFELPTCPKMRSLRIDATPSRPGRGLRETAKAKDAVDMMFYFAWTKYPWSRLEELSLAWPHLASRSTQTADRPRPDFQRYVDLRRESGRPLGPGDVSTLEMLDLRGISLQDSAGFARQCANFPNLRELDLSESSVTNEDLYTILDHCPKLHRIDLTSCRGINVRDRRNIFEAHRKARLGNPEHDRP